MTTTKSPPVNKAHIEHRVADWIERLSALFSQVDAWREELIPASKPLHAEILQRDEGLMQNFKVKPRKVPTYAFRFGKGRISFVPMALWVIGANGRVNIIADNPDRQFMLIDIGGKDGQPSDWHIAVKDSKRFHVAFTKEILRCIIDNKL